MKLEYFSPTIATFEINFDPGVGWLKDNQIKDTEPDLSLHQ